MNIHSTNRMRVGSFRGLLQFIQGSLFLYLISFASMAQPPSGQGHPLSSGLAALSPLASGRKSLTYTVVTPPAHTVVTLRDTLATFGLMVTFTDP